MGTTGPKFVGYVRVSTQAQGRSGLGLEAQRAAILEHVRKVGGELAAEFVEVESGRKDARPELARAMACARRLRAVLVLARLDRLARSTRFLLTLAESGLDLLFLDLPNIPPGPAGRFLLSVMASVAELEAGMTSQRTKAALQAAKARGTKLGGRREGSHVLGVEDRARGGRATASRRRQRAREAVADLLPQMQRLREEGASLTSIAAKLNEAGHRTSTGRAWGRIQVRRALSRADG